MTRRWQPTRKPTAAAQSATRRTYNLANCRMGQHTMIATFRAGEQVCIRCGVVLYCPVCFTVNKLPAPTAHKAYPLFSPS